ncbi:hypothetical protein BS47DRAFT_1369148 [Hydnum rufescens UP504]|uniref:Uncharacterized protein n=1 Tax=Hydnum rufescens UP504 TaxID=1448309 RepID=A0A9P6ADW9_9AGAM|nr:hypothetical protein BS47DRAFT_1369148 [Hydnum rufescens UP504]
MPTHQMSMGQTATCQTKLPTPHTRQSGSVVIYKVRHRLNQKLPDEHTPNEPPLPNDNLLNEPPPNENPPNKDMPTTHPLWQTSPEQAPPLLPNGNPPNEQPLNEDPPNQNLPNEGPTRTTHPPQRATI